MAAADAVDGEAALAGAAGQELLDAEGRYAKLFQLQAERFARGEEEGEEEDDEL